jgi:hypothetical protein
MTEKLQDVAKEVKTVMEKEKTDFLKATHAALHKFGFPTTQRGLLIYQVAAILPSV